MWRSEVRIILAANPKCGLLNQSHTKLISCMSLIRSAQTSVPHNDANFGIGLAAGVERRSDMARNAPGATSIASKRMSRMRASGLCASHTSAAAAMRWRWRGVTDQAASSRFSRALTSTKINSVRRRAMMSISPTGLRQRRARMRKPLAIRKAAARLSAEMPVRNATWRSGCGLHAQLQARLIRIWRGSGRRSWTQRLQRSGARPLIGHGRARG